MYRTRGRPEDPWNRDALLKEKAIAETIQIRSLNKTSANDGIRDENARRRLNYEEFRETYQQKFQKSKEASRNKRAQMSQDLHEYMQRRNQVVIPNPITNSTQTSTSSKPNVCEKRPSISRGLKTVTVDVPHPKTAGAIIVPQSNIQHKQPLVPERKELSKTVLMKQLVETQGQIDEANDQLEQIQQLLRDKQLKLNSDESLTNVNNNASNVSDLYKKNPFTRYALFKSSEQRLNVMKEYKGEIGTPFPSGLYSQKPSATKVAATPEASKDKKTAKIKKTLKDVNDMIQKMQDKYFSKPRTRYKSVLEYTNKPSPVSVLYENNKYPQEVAPQKESPLEDELSYSEHKSAHKEVCSSNCNASTYDSTNFNQSHVSIGSDMETIFQDSSSVSMILPPKNSQIIEDNTKKQVSCCMGFSKKTNETSDSFYNLSNAVQEGVSGSEYLMREFRNTGQVESYPKTTLCSGKKSVHFSTTNTFNVNNGCKAKKQEQLNTFMKSALKESLYKM